MHGRVIKFRAWDLEEKKMYTEAVSFSTNHMPANYEIMQFTGLLDKNNKEIYEGDVVKTWPEHPVFLLKSPNNEFNSEKAEDHRLKYTAGQIMWQSTGWWVGQWYLGAAELNEFALCDCCPCGLEIIGNIFENPDLVKFIEKSEKAE